ncbi:hypothetical protein GCM10009564_32560 [Streptomyces thermogriseus]|uniref:Uncharacterized protein n=1 Tax=Streptomyces thermogriseus TaxID=75292 RepID=A0ABN1T1H4_9ACTN
MPTEDATALPQPAAPEGQPLLRKLFAPPQRPQPQGDPDAAGFVVMRGAPPALHPPALPRRGPGGDLEVGGGGSGAPSSAGHPRGPQAAPGCQAEPPAAVARGASLAPRHALWSAAPARPRREPPHLGGVCGTPPGKKRR